MKERASLQDVRDAVAGTAVRELARAHAGRGRERSPRQRRSSASACGCWTSRTGSTPTATKACVRCCMRLAAHYFLNAKNGDGYPVDPVARFHLGNGARLERINWQGDISAKGLREAHGLMCNYRYELKDIEKNHEAYENEGVVAASRQVHALLKLERGRSEAGRFLQLPGLRTVRSGAGQADERVAPQHRGSDPCDTAKTIGKARTWRTAAARAAAGSAAAAAFPSRSAAAGLSITSLLVIGAICLMLGHQPARAAERRRRHAEDAGHAAHQSALALALRASGRPAAARRAAERRDVALRAPRAGRHRGRVGARVPGRRQDATRSRRWCCSRAPRRRRAASASRRWGPFYCPLDQKVYIDLDFYRELKERFHAPGDFAQAYVIAHEVGHHVQTLLGICRQGAGASSSRRCSAATSARSTAAGAHGAAGRLPGGRMGEPERSGEEPPAAGRCRGRAQRRLPDRRRHAAEAHAGPRGAGVVHPRLLASSACAGSRRGSTAAGRRPATPSTASRCDLSCRKG